jgi:membrane dipeptidase
MASGTPALAIRSVSLVELSGKNRRKPELLEWLGEDGVGMGSDFDGASIPDVVGDASGLQRIIEAFQGHGYGDELIEKIAWKNWLAMLEKTIG